MAQVPTYFPDVDFEAMLVSRLDTLVDLIAVAAVEVEHVAHRRLVQPGLVAEPHPGGHHLGEGHAPVAEVVDAVDQSPFKDNTIIVVTSDHGWNMCEKDYLFKNSPWEESCRIPFVVRAPGVAKPGGVAEHPISLIDLYPTLVDLCGLPKETRKNDNGAPLDGHSVRPFLENPTAGRWDGPEGALSMIYIGELNRGYSGAEKDMVENQHWSYRTKRWRYIRYNDGMEELYDHDSDPREWNNLASSPEHAAVKQSLKKQMFAMIDSTKIKMVPAEAAPAAQNKKWDWFNALDANRDKQVTKDEWLAWHKGAAVRRGEPYREKVPREHFEKLDGDNDAIITRNELEARNKK